MKLTITRLRSGTNYKEPLHDIMDSFYYLYKEYIQNNNQHQYGVCNFGWGKANRRKLDDAIDSDVILIPSENEFFYHIPGYIDPLYKKRSDDFIQQLGPYLKNKHLIIMRSDRADSEELYRTKTFARFNIGKVSVLDEMDIPGGLHGMKYYFIRDRLPLFLPDSDKQYDFIYWGCDKRKWIDGKESGDERHLIFKQIRKENKVTSYFIGKYASIQPDKRIDSMYNLVPILASGKTTLCFNWIDSTATTSRYHEAIACGIFPFVWKNYDSNNTIIADSWQRVSSIDEFYDKQKLISSKIEKVFSYYMDNTLQPKEWYYRKFEERLNNILNGN